MKVFSGDPEPPEARVRTPRARDTKEALGQFRYFRRPEPPEARAGSLGEISDDAFREPPTAGGMRALPCRRTRKGHVILTLRHHELSLPTPSLRRRAREASGKDAKEVGHLHPRAGQEEGAACPRVHDMGVFDRPEPPEACTRTLGEGRVFADPKPSEASAGSLGR
ncbi:hypothetical protein K525DRAFT_275236 [Schizophyllum commune Loenen D]|nr:hypothetical protein K525DRAFT_275236 [Schizophyllum commune Loenen D]